MYTGKIEDIKVQVEEFDLYAITFILANSIEISIPAVLFRKFIREENFEFEILVGEIINIEFYEVDELVDKEVVSFYSSHVKHCYDILKEENYYPCNLKNTIVKSIKIPSILNFVQFKHNNFNRIIRNEKIVSTVLGIQVKLIKLNQNVVLILDNHLPIKISASYLKQVSELEPHEFEILIGQTIIFSFYRVGEMINVQEQLCQFPNRLIKNLFVSYDLPFNTFYEKNLHRRYPFKKIIDIKKSHEPGCIQLITEDKNEYPLNIKYSQFNFTWHFFTLKDCYVLPLEKSTKFHLNDNFLLRLTSTFFKNLKIISEKEKEKLENLYKLTIQTNFYYEDEGVRYNSQDFIDDALGGEAEAFWNLE